MAQRLEAALRKPLAEPRPQNAPPPHPGTAEPAAGDAAPAIGGAPRMPPRPAAPKPRSDNKPNQRKDTVYDSLEQEMASLLGRPPKN
jgi:hypothetical protein